jgi:hypothetical protein
MALPTNYRSLVEAADDLLVALETNDVAKIMFARTSLRQLLDKVDNDHILIPNLADYRKNLRENRGS